MPRVRAAFIRLRALFRRDRLDRELSAEIESHVAHHIDDNLRVGMTPDEARRHALARLGGVTQVKERYRDGRGVPAFEHWINDIRHGARMLRRAPIFTGVAVLTLAFGIGANTAIFSVVNAVLIRPMPVDRPDRLVTIGRATGFPTHSYPDYRDLRDRNTVLLGLVAYRFSPMNLDADGTGTRIWGMLTTGNYFDVLGVRASLGRALSPGDDAAPGRQPVLVLSDALWRSRFAADPAIAGRTVKINGMVFTVLGVMPPGFRGTERLFAPAVWVPMAMQAHVESGNDWLERRQTHNIFLLGRLRNDVTRAQAEAQLNVVAEQLGREYPQLSEGMRFSLATPGLIGNVLRGPVAGFGGALLGIAALVLLLTCTNLAGLMLARSTDRQRDTAVRLALGAGRFDLIRRALVESGLVSLAGAIAAALLAWWLSSALTVWRLPVDFPIAPDVVLDHRVLFACFGLGLGSTLLVGLLPALQGSRTDIVPALKDETTRWRGGWHVRDGIVAAQVALSTILLVGSLLVVRSLLQATRVDVGFVPRGAVTMKVDLGLEGYDQARARDFQRRIVERLARIPGFDAVATASALPLSMDTSTHTVYVEGKPVLRGAARPSAIYYQVSPRFFRSFGTRLVAGRDFSEADTQDRPRVAVVNQTFASRLLAGGNPIGQRFRTGTTGAWIEVVGVVEDGKYQTLAEAPTEVAFHSAIQWYNPSTTVVARTSLDEAQAVDAARRVMRELDPGIAIFEDGPLSGVLALPLLPTRIAATLLGAFGALAIVMVLVGTYGVISYGIAQRTREICIRLAIGASAPQIVRLVLGRAAGVWAAGVGAGLIAAMAGAPLLTPILLGVEPRDPLIPIAATVVLALVTSVASWHPARRAVRTDPGALLRRG